MTTVVEGKHSIFMGAQAFLLENDRETASSWASEHITKNPAYKWVLGRFVEADRPNNNKQLFSLEGLQMSRPTIAHAPMNLNHSSRRVVGAYVATDLVYPTDGASVESADLTCGAPIFDADGKQIGVVGELAQVSDAGLNPYIEALGVFWRRYFPEEYALVEAAHAEGRLYYSMECVPQQVQCAGAAGCGETYEYDGRVSDTYCSHLNEHVSDKFLINPHFTAGAVLVQGVRPGWSHADVHTLVAGYADLAETIYDGVSRDLSHLDPRDWELLMNELLILTTR